MEQNANNQNEEVKMATLKTLRAQEMQFVTDHAQQVSAIKNERDKLEQERAKIMGQLANMQRTKSNQSQFRQAGAAILTSDSKFKDRLIEDEAKIMRMKAERQSMEGSILNMDDIDVLYNGLDSRPKFHEGINNLKNQTVQRKDPFVAQNL